MSLKSLLFASLVLLFIFLSIASFYITLYFSLSNLQTAQYYDNKKYSEIIQCRKRDSKRSPDQFFGF